MSLTVLNKDGSIMGRTINQNLEPSQNPYAAPFGTNQQQQTQNTQKNDQQWGAVNWAYNQSPSPQPSGGSKAPDMSVYSPGKAQPVQQPSTGAPYGNTSIPLPTYGTEPRPADYGVNWSLQPGVNAPSDPYASVAPGVYYGGQQIQGNQQQALATAMAQRDAMATLVNNNNLKYQMANAFGQDLGQPQFDYGSAMQQAQNMVANGFYNPFTQYYNQATDPVSQLGQYAPPPMYSPPQPFPPIGGFGVQQPQQPAPEPPEYSYKQVPGSEWDQVQQAWRLPAKTQQQASPMPASPSQPSAPQAPPSPRVSPTTPTSGNWIQRPDGQWEETQPKMYGGMDPVLKAPESYRPGTAQPIQPPSQGTPWMPYGGPTKTPLAPAPAKQPGTVTAGTLSEPELARAREIGAQLKLPDIKRALISHGDKVRQKALGGNVEFTAEELAAYKLAGELGGLQGKAVKQDDAGLAERRKIADEIRAKQMEKSNREKRMKDAFAATMKRTYPNDWQRRVREVYR